MGQCLTAGQPLEPLAHLDHQALQADKRSRVSASHFRMAGQTETREYPHSQLKRDDRIARPVEVKPQRWNS